jgi:hypothetical protein
MGAIMKNAALALFIGLWQPDVVVGKLIPLSSIQTEEEFDKNHLYQLSKISLNLTEPWVIKSLETYSNPEVELPFIDIALFNNSTELNNSKDKKINWGVSLYVYHKTDKDKVTEYFKAVETYYKTKQLGIPQTIFFETKSYIIACDHGSDFPLKKFKNRYPKFMKSYRNLIPELKAFFDKEYQNL